MIKCMESEEAVQNKSKQKNGQNGGEVLNN